MNSSVNRTCKFTLAERELYYSEILASSVMNSEKILPNINSYCILDNKPR